MKEQLLFITVKSFSNAQLKYTQILKHFILSLFLNAFKIKRNLPTLFPFLKTKKKHSN